MENKDILVLDDNSTGNLKLPVKNIIFNVGSETKIEFALQDDKTLDVKVYGNYEESVKAFADYLKKVFDGVEY